MCLGLGASGIDHRMFDIDRMHDAIDDRCGWNRERAVAAAKIHDIAAVGSQAELAQRLLRREESRPHRFIRHPTFARLHCTSLRDDSIARRCGHLALMAWRLKSSGEPPTGNVVASLRIRVPAGAGSAVWCIGSQSELSRTSHHAKNSIARISAGNSSWSNMIACTCRWLTMR